MYIQGENPFTVTQCSLSRDSITRQKTYSCNICSKPDILQSQYSTIFAGIDESISAYHHALELDRQLIDQQVQSFLEGIQPVPGIQPGDGSINPTGSTGDGTTGGKGDGIQATTGGTVKPTEVGGSIKQPDLMVTLYENFNTPSCRNLQFFKDTWQPDLTEIIPDPLMEKVSNFTTEHHWAGRVAEAQKLENTPVSLMNEIAQASSDKLIRFEAYDRVLHQTFAMLMFMADLNAQVDQAMGLEVSTHDGIQDNLIKSFKTVALTVLSLYQENTDSQLNPNTEPSEIFIKDALKELIDYFVHHSGLIKTDIANHQNVPNFGETITKIQINMEEVIREVIREVMMLQFSSRSMPFTVQECPIVSISKQRFYSCAICGSPYIMSNYGASFNSIDDLIRGYHTKLEEDANILDEQVRIFLQSITQPVDGGTIQPTEGEIIDINHCMEFSVMKDWTIVLPAEIEISNSLRWLVANFSTDFSQRFQSLYTSLSKIYRENQIGVVLNTTLYFQSDDAFKLNVASSIGEKIIHAFGEMWEMYRSMDANNTNDMSGTMLGGNTDGSQLGEAPLITTFGIPSLMFFPSENTLRYFRNKYQVEILKINSNALQLLSSLQHETGNSTEDYIYTLISTIISDVTHKYETTLQNSNTVPDTMFLASFGDVGIDSFLTRAFTSVNRVWEQYSSTISQTYQYQYQLTPNLLTVKCSAIDRKTTGCNVCLKPEEADPVVMKVTESTMAIMTELDEILASRISALREFLYPAGKFNHF